MDPSLRETLRQRHEARLAEQRRVREEEESARFQAEEEERRLQEQEDRRLAEEQAERLVPLVQVQGDLQDLVALVRTATRPNQIIPALRNVAMSVQESYDPDIQGAGELVGELQAVVTDLVLAFNDNEGLVLQVGSYEYNTIQELIQVITTTMGVDIEIAAPVMDTSRDEEIARQLAGPAPTPAPSSYMPSSLPVRVEDGMVELSEYTNILAQLRSMRSASQHQVRAIMRNARAPPSSLSSRQRERLRTALQNLITYVRNRWVDYDLEEQLGMLEEYSEGLN